MAKEEFKIMQNGMEFVKKRDFWSMKKQSSRKTLICRDTLIKLDCWIFFLGAHTRTKH